MFFCDFGQLWPFQTNMFLLNQMLLEITGGLFQRLILYVLFKLQWTIEQDLEYVVLQKVIELPLWDQYKADDDAF